MISARERHLKRKYGLSLDDYNALLKIQDGKCFICGRSHQDVNGKRLSVDHNHKTGEVRGLLCTFCNRYVIGRHTNPDLFKRAWEYLKKGTGHFVPKPTTNRRRRKGRKRKKR